MTGRRDDRLCHVISLKQATENGIFFVRQRKRGGDCSRKKENEGREAGRDAEPEREGSRNLSTAV